jgi:hypothetical protein
MARLDAGCQRALQEAQPRCGVTLDRVTRPSGMLGPRVRQAPDGRTEGGRQPPHSRRSNRRIVLAPALPMHRGQKTS